MAITVLFHVYAGRCDPFCDVVNSRTEHERAAKSLYTRYVNKGAPYVELVKRTWDDARDGCKDGCCGYTLETLRSVGKLVTCERFPENEHKHHKPCSQCGDIHRTSAYIPGCAMGGSWVAGMSVEDCRQCGKRLNYKSDAS